jgi:polyferredoxin
MTQATPTLYAAREPIFPRRVTGRFRTLKWWVMAVTLGIYYLTPWLRWDRGPERPDQAVLVDLASGRAYFFFLEIWSHEFYFVAGLLIMAGLGLFLFTSALGRVWCGYTCPQTVWTDLFLTVERWIEGDRNARVRLHAAPWGPRKAALRLTKWAVWLAIAMATGGAWVFYFADAPTLARDLVTGQAASAAYATVAVLTATTFVFGGFMREQVCIYMCPWPRIQGAMMDEGTLTVAYRAWRGEPRAKGRRGAPKAQQVLAEQAGGRNAPAYAGTPYPRRRDAAPSAAAAPAPVLAPAAGEPGDCIDCMACVNVCPMGIDIRDGQQLECITCALCIDACDDVMGKVGLPRGLIDYVALSDEAKERAGQPPIPVWKHILRPRTVVYTTLWALLGVALAVAMLVRSDLELTVAPVRNPTFVTLSDGSVRNTYDLRVRNKAQTARRFTLSVTGDPALVLTVEGAEDGSVSVPADRQAFLRAYVVAPPGSAPAGAAETAIAIGATADAPEDGAETSAVSVDTRFIGKGN